MIQVFASPIEISFAVADIFVQSAYKAIAQNQKFTVALTGGSMMLQVYKLLAAYPYVDQVEWDKVFIFWTNERWVTHNDGRNNFKQVFETLISHVPIPVNHVFQMQATGADPVKFAGKYEQLLYSHLGNALSFDLVLLNMGKDGHIASLYPGTEVLKENSKPVRTHFITSKDIYHTTLTAPLINRAQKIVVVVSGQDKAPILREVLEGVRNVQKYPAQLLTPQNGEILWLTDKPAASQLLISFG